MLKIWEEKTLIPTYEVGEPEKNPVFLEKRVYQGSSGKIYPYPAIEKISDVKVDKEYNAVYLENDYIKIMVLPQIGGRIQRAYDKTNGYDFIYYNHVIKPALVGLTGPWISGGIEINWPQHHRPTTFSPTDYAIVKGENSVTLKINDTDLMYGTKSIASYTLYEGKAYIEIEGQLYNGTSLPQTFLWWANPAVAVNDFTQSIFPPDVHAVMDHGKRDVSKFPIATGVYYKKDYSDGVDISRYKNIPVPTSYMAEKSEYDFIGGYDYSVGAGLLHIADHHVSPGKKQWTWGCGDFGKMWDKNLTDEDGPYIELMTGVYTDNQPDFSWLKPFEEKKFKQYFMPYKAVGQVKNATLSAAVNLECENDIAHICVYATSKYEKAKIVLRYSGRVISKESATISPVDIYTADVKLDADTDITLLEVSVYDARGRVLVSYMPKKEELREMPLPAEAAKEPEDIQTNEELYLTGLHIEQYRHATYLPDPYYLEGLKRDKNDIRLNNAYGLLMLRRGRFDTAEEYFRRALVRLTQRNGNPYNSEVYYNLGLVLFYQCRYDEAYDSFFKSAWTAEQQEMAYYYLAAIDTRRGNYEYALELIDKSLVKNSHNVKARGLKTVILRRLGKRAEARKFALESLEIDNFDYLTLNEIASLDSHRTSYYRAMAKELMREYDENYLGVARAYAECGCYKEAVAVLKRIKGGASPMVKYYCAYYNSFCNTKKEMLKCLRDAEREAPDCCFPNKLEDIAVLNFAIKTNPKASRAFYYLGNLYYDKMQYTLARNLWEKSVALSSDFPTALRNLALAYYNKFDKKTEARELLEKAFALDKTDARIFLELDQLYRKLDIPVEQRLANYEDNRETFEMRDDLVIEYITLHNLKGEYSKAYSLIEGRKFHPWEGGEGKITAQYRTSLIELAKQSLENKDYANAEKLLRTALVYPDNLGEGKLEGSKDNDIYYYLGTIYRTLKKDSEADKMFEIASIGTSDPAGMMYYNDQPADMIMYEGLALLALGRTTEAKSHFHKLIDYGEKHIFDNPKIEYFAVSLPDFLIYEDDLKKRNSAHCHYLMGLGNLGLENYQKAAEEFERALEFDYAHLNCIRYLSDTKKLMKK